MLGSGLSTTLRSQGHHVVRLVRRAADSPAEISWDPARGVLDPTALKGFDAVVNLSGAPLIQLPRRWTRSFIEELYASRIGPTRTLATAIASADEPPKVLLNQSGAGYYGEHPQGELDESGPLGQGILADLCAHWEEATAAAEETARVVRMRTGVVFGIGGGALAKLLLPLRLGLGGRLGNGEQIWPWISQLDLTAAMIHLLENPLSGPVNLVAPENASLNQIVTELARALHRPHAFPVPAFLLELGLGKKAADEVLLTSTRTRPAALLGSGFSFVHPEVAGAADWIASQLKEK